MRDLLQLLEQAESAEVGDVRLTDAMLILRTSIENSLAQDTIDQNIRRVVLRSTVVWHGPRADAWRREAVGHLKSAEARKPLRADLLTLAASSPQPLHDWTVMEPLVFEQVRPGMVIMILSGLYRVVAVDDVLIPILVVEGMSGTELLGHTAFHSTEKLSLHAVARRA